jgi:CHAD domain-containing protein
VSYAIRPSRSVGKELRRLLLEQADAGIGACAGADLDNAHEAVHEVRRCLKKARSALRLGRSALDADAFRRENSFLRDVGRSISQVRDAQAVVEAVEELAESFAGDATPVALAPALDAVRRLRDGAAAPGELNRALAAAGDQLTEARGRLARLSFDGAGFSAIAPGLRRGYRDARKAMRRAGTEPGDEARHEWRKRVKDHRYHVQLLRSIGPEALGARLAELHRLTDLLGADQDLATLEALLDCRPELDAGALRPLIGQRRTELIAAAGPLSARLLAERPAAFVERMGRLWAAAAGAAAPARA